MTVVGFLLLATAEVAVSGWKTLAPGMELGSFAAREPAAVGDSRIHVLRIDPRLWELVVLGTSQVGGKKRTARQWAAEYRLKAAINAGMFATDHRTHVGYLGARGHVNNGRVNEYLSAAAFDPREPGRTPFRIFDLDEPGVSVPGILAEYESVVQNLRLIKRPGINRWSPQKKKWSEAALGEDRAGRALFIFCRSPYDMHQFNRELLEADLGLVAAQHLEGGPEAQLYVRAGAEEIELYGSYETSFQEDMAQAAPWPVPIVLGARPRAEAAK